MDFKNLLRINDMARYTFIARGFREGRGKRVAVDARTKAEAEQKALELTPGANLELVSRVASSKGALGPKNPFKARAKGKGPGKYKIEFSVYDEKELVASQAKTVEAESEDDAYNQAYSMYEEWRENHERTISTHTTYLATKL